MAAQMHRSAFAILLTLVFSFGAGAADLGAEAYCLPLVEPYGVYRSDAEAALRGVGILDPNVVKVPDALAVGVPDRVLRPWKYRMGGRWFGISDDMLSLVVQVLGLMFAFVLGLTWRGKSLMAAAIALGVIVNVVAQMVIAGGGPGAFVGFVVLPVLCMLAAAFGRGVRALVS